jgi:hypothetical protein
VGNEVAFVVGWGHPICNIALEVDILDGPEGGFCLSVEGPNLHILDRVEEKAVCGWCKEWVTGDYTLFLLLFVQGLPDGAPFDIGLEILTGKGMDCCVSSYFPL